MPTKFHPNGTTHGIVMTSYRFAAMELEIHPNFGFSDNTRFAMSNSISTPDFDTIAQSTAVLLLLLL